MGCSWSQLEHHNILMQLAAKTPWLDCHIELVMASAARPHTAVGFQHSVPTLASALVVAAGCSTASSHERSFVTAQTVLEGSSSSEALAEDAHTGHWSHMAAVGPGSERLAHTEDTGMGTGRHCWEEEAVAVCCNYTRRQCIDHTGYSSSSVAGTAGATRCAFSYGMRIRVMTVLESV
jgi:hypothetical protein